MNKKLLFILLAAMLILSACGNNDKQASSGDGSKENAHLNVVTSFYPIYYMTKQIGGEHVNVVNLISTGVEPHDWTPKSKDLLTASEADLLLYHGVGLETWIDNFVKGLEKDSSVVIKQVSNGIELIDPDDAEEHDHDHEGEDDGHDHDGGAEDDHDHEAHSEEEHDHDHDIDPHTWVSPKSARIIAENIKDSLIEVDPEHTAMYEKNYTELDQKLKNIDEKYEQQLDNVAIRTIVVSHQSFGYVARDYNLEQVSIMGLSPNAEPRAQDIKNIAKVVKDSGVKVIFFEELVSDKLAKMLASEAKAETNVIYSLEGLTTKQEKAGEDYLTLMERNLQNLVEALK